MKHIKTIINGNEPQMATPNCIKDVHYAMSCKTSVTLGTNFNSEKRN